MDIKKDPGKFTIRFCMADPRQKRAELETIVRSILENIPRSSQAVGAPAESKVRSNATPDTFLTEENLNTIAGTLKAFRR